MRLAKTGISRLLALIVCFVSLLGYTPALASGNSQVKLVFAGNVLSPNLQVIPYSQTVGEFIADRLGADENIISSPCVDIDSGGFIEKAADISTQSPDAVFLEFDISKKYKGDEDEIASRVEAVVRKLTAGEKVPAIYFIYAPEATFLDYREPFNRVAEYYGITVIDTYDYFREKYINRELETSDFLTAGLIPGEEGHKYFSQFIVNKLKGEKDLLKQPQHERSAMYSASYDGAVQEEKSPDSSVDAEQSIIYVSTRNGSDAATGTEASPLKTLAEAKKRVRIIKEKQGEKFGGITVYLREGLYQVGDGFVLDKEDSGTESGEIIYSGYPGERVKVTNAEVLNPSDFSKVANANTLSRLPTGNAQANVLEFDLRAAGISGGTYMTGNQNYYGTNRSYGMGNMLVVNDKMEQRAQYPNGGWQFVSDKNGKTTNTLTYTENVGTRWTTADNAWVKGIFGQGYYSDKFKVMSVDADARKLSFARNSAYGISSGYLWCLVNLLEELDMPSEWYVDEKTQKLYYYPRGDISGQEILFSSNTKPIITLNATEHITISNMEFTAGSGSAVKIVDGNSNTVDSCEIGNMGYVGVHIDCSDKKGPGNNGVKNCHIYNTAISGVMLEGGDRRELTPSNDYVENCHFESYATEMHSEAGAVLTDGTVGVRISNNIIHRDDSSAIFMGGNDDLIEYNEIYNVSYDTDDYGVIYGDSRGAMRQGVTMRKNYMHDIVYDFPPYKSGMLAGFYSDANRNNGARVDSNVFIKVQTPIFFSNNHNMAARGNLFMDCTVDSLRVWSTPYDNATTVQRHAAIAKALADGTFHATTGKGESQAIDKLVYRAYQTTPEFTEETEKHYYLKYPWLEHYLTSEPLLAKYVVINNNASFNCEGTIDVPNGGERYLDTTQNYMVKETIEAKEGENEFDRVDKAMAIADEKLPDFEVWDVREAGLKGETKPVSNFDIVYPANGQENIDVTDLRLRWDYASGADEYHVIVAKDKNFKDIVFEDTTVKDYVQVTGLSFGSMRYYWKVTASSYSEAFTGTPENNGGVHSFVSMRRKSADFSYLNAEILSAKTTLEELVEGDEPGLYPAGTKDALAASIESAEEVANNIRAKQEAIDAALAQISAARLGALAKINMKEINFAELYDEPSEIQIFGDGGAALTTGDQSKQIQKVDGGLEFKGNGATFTTEKIGVHEVVHFKAKFDFGGKDSGSIYTMIGLRTQKPVNHLWSTSSYVFLVTKSNIELQAFKPTSVGKFYMTIPNTFIEEGKEHDIQFCAVPSDGGVRIILQVDGKIAYDYTDSENIITSGGLGAVETSNALCGITIMPPDENAEYPSLLERIKNSEAKSE